MSPNHSGVILFNSSNSSNSVKISIFQIKTRIFFEITLGPAYEFGYNEHSAKTNRIMYIKIVVSNAEKFGQNNYLYICAYFTSDSRVD